MGISISRNNFLEQYPEKVEQAISEAIKKGCLAVEASAKQKCPVDTGNLRASIAANMVDEKVGEVGTNVEYAAYVEYGTKNQSAQPFLYPALQEQRGNIVKEIEKALGGK